VPPGTACVDGATMTGTAYDPPRSFDSGDVKTGRDTAPV
jgi:hypothetical protein